MISVRVSPKFTAAVGTAVIFWERSLHAIGVCASFFWCGGDIRLIAFITDPAPIRKILHHIGEPVEPPPISPARGPPTEWNELVQVHDDRDGVQDSPDELPIIDIHAL